MLILTETEFQKFIMLKNESKVVGILTNNGVILCDKVIVCAGIES